VVSDAGINAASGETVFEEGEEVVMVDEVSVEVVGVKLNEGATVCVTLLIVDVILDTIMSDDAAIAVPAVTKNIKQITKSLVLLNIIYEFG